MRTDPRGRQYLWIGGPSVHHAPSEGTDTAAYDAGYASITPLTIDLFASRESDAAARLAIGADALARRARGFRAGSNGGTSSPHARAAPSPRDGTPPAPRRTTKRSTP
jgi:hypothetical protein